MQLRFRLASAVLPLLLIGCSAAEPTSTPTHAPTLTRLPSTDAPTLTLAPTAITTEAPTSELPPAKLIEPLVEDQFVQFVGWSPEGEWIVYWRGAGSPGGPEPPDAALTFHHLDAGQICPHPELAYDHYVEVRWGQDGTAMVSLGSSVTQVTPCGDSLPTALPAFRFGPDSPAAPSPNETYLAYTYETGPADEYNRAPVETILRENGGGPIFARAEWTTPGGLGSIGPGGEWISDDLFLIRRTWDRGPLLLGIDGSVIEVAPELFGAPAVPETTPGEEYLWAADGAIDDEGNTHLALLGAGVESAFPLVQLYHSETGEVETLEHTHVWEPTFSPDGEWLLLQEQRVDSGYESPHLWARPTDPAGGALQHVGGGSLFTAFDPGWTRAAMGYGHGRSERGVQLFSFPEGALLEAWDTGVYEPVPVAWSPDGARLAIAGSTVGEMALFVAEP